MKTLTIPTDIRDVESGEIIKRETAKFFIAPAPEGTCPECAVTHEPGQPHNAESIHYQYHFFAENNRWPNWNDAMAHCSQETKDRWIKELARLGIIVNQKAKSDENEY